MVFRRKTKFRKYKKTAGKRGVKRRKSGGGKRVAKRRRTSGSYSGGRKYGGGGFGILSKRRWVKLKYINCGCWVPTANMDGSLRVSGNDNIYRANSVYDPQYAGVGGSQFNQKSAGHGFWSMIYNKYEVLKSTIKLTFRQVTPSTMPSTAPLVIGLRVDDDASITGYTNYEQFVGDMNTKWKTMTFAADPSQAKPVVLRAVWKKKYGGNPGDNYCDTAGSQQPINSDYFIPWFQTADKVAYNLQTGIPRLSYQASITYWVRYLEPKDLGSSSMIVQS